MLKFGVFSKRCLIKYTIEAIQERLSVSEREATEIIVQKIRQGVLSNEDTGFKKFTYKSFLSWRLREYKL